MIDTVGVADRSSYIDFPFSNNALSKNGRHEELQWQLVEEFLQRNENQLNFNKVNFTYTNNLIQRKCA